MSRAIAFLMLCGLCSAQVFTVDAGGADDRGFVGGTVEASYTTQPDPSVRYGLAGAPFSYVFQVDPGVYLVTLRFYEPNKRAAGLRRFTVGINGTTTDSIDLFARGAVNPQTPVDVPLITIATVGSIRLDFKAQTGNALVSSIKVERYWMYLPASGPVAGGNWQASAAPTLQDLPPGPLVKNSIAVKGGGFIDVYGEAHDDYPLFRDLAAFGNGPGVLCIAPGQGVVPCSLLNGSFSVHMVGDIQKGQIYFGAPEIRYGEVLTYDLTNDRWLFPVYRPNPAYSVAIFVDGVRLDPSLYTINLIQDNLPFTVTIKAPTITPGSKVLADYVATGLITVPLQ